MPFLKWLNIIIIPRNSLEIYSREMKTYKCLYNFSNIISHNSQRSSQLMCSLKDKWVHPYNGLTVATMLLIYTNKWTSETSQMTEAQASLSIHISDSSIHIKSKDKMMNGWWGKSKRKAQRISVWHFLPGETFLQVAGFLSLRRYLALLIADRIHWHFS